MMVDARVTKAIEFQRRVRFLSVTRVKFQEAEMLRATRVSCTADSFIGRVSGAIPLPDFLMRLLSLKK